MDRDIEKNLLAWKHKSHPFPLLVRGARQVGKTYTVEQFGKKHFKDIVTINFELQPELITCFDNLNPHAILNTLYLLTKKKVEPGKTLLFLDEIQECPNAILAMRYFKEQLPELHVIGAGSLLEFLLNDAEFSMPVGRVQSLYLKPLSFKEYLVASGNQALRECIENVDLKNPISEVIHKQLLNLVREYMILGGMPAVLESYIIEKTYTESVLRQSILLNTYRQDFGKYAKKTNHRYLQRLFEKIPGLIGENFKYSKVDPDMKSRDLKEALFMLKNANLVYPVYSNAATGLPLISLSNEKKFKLLFLDVGLVSYANKLEAELMDENILLVNRGMLAEQFVGQEMIAYHFCFEDPQLYFWSREKPSSMAEVDFITTVGPIIIPIEVKAGATGRLKSLSLFLEEKKSKIGIRFSQQNISYHEKILSLPLYMVGEIDRLVKEIL